MIFCYRRLLHSSLGHGGLSGGDGLAGNRGLDLWSLSEGSLAVLLSVLLGEGLGGLGGLGGSLLSLDVLQRQTDESLLDSLGSPGSLLSVGLGLTLLVHLSPGLSPVELDRLDSLSEQRSNLVADEEVDLAVLRNKALTSSRIDAVLGELAKLSLDNHLSTTN